MLAKKKKELLLSVLVTWVLASYACGEASQEPKEGTFIGGFVSINNIGGRFDGKWLYDFGGYQYDIPNIDSGLGGGLVLGSRKSGGAYELSYQHSFYDTSSIVLGASKAQMNMINLDLKIDVFAKPKLKPQVLFGVGIPWLTIGAGKIEGATVGRATYVGYAFNFGGAMSYYVTPQWALNGSIFYRYMRFDSLNGADIRGLYGSGINYTLGLAHTFN